MAKKDKKEKEEIKAKEETNKKNLAELIALSVLVAVPLIISIGTIISVKISSVAPIIAASGVQLSPVSDSVSLIRGLSIFTVFYIIFIAVIVWRARAVAKTISLAKPAKTRRR